MQETVAGRREEDEEMRETAREEKPLNLVSGIGSRYFVINFCASYRMEVIYGTLVTIDVACIHRGLFASRYTALCIQLQNIPLCFHSSTSTL